MNYDNNPNNSNGTNPGSLTGTVVTQQPTGGINFGTPATVVSSTGNLPMASEMQNLTEYKQRLRLDPSVQALTNKIEVQNPNSIIVFGQEASEEISKISDQLLSSMRAVKSEEAGEMLIHLTKIMDKFDIKELDGTQKDGVLSKVFRAAGNTVAKLFQKYDMMGTEVDKVYQLLLRYESDIKEANHKLKQLYDGNLRYYQMLEQYIVAGEMAIEELEAYILQVSNDNTMAQDERSMTAQKLEMCKDILSQRVYDLQLAESVALQAAPMINTIQMSNFNLMRKINSSFIITLPIFKQCLAQAVILRRQEIEAKAIKQLDDKTNELLIRNSQRTADQSVAIAKMASGGSIQIETLTKSYETIRQGIEATKAIQAQSSEERKQNSLQLEQMKADMKRTGLVTN